MATHLAPTEADIWERIIRPRGRMTRAAARRIQQLQFSPEDRERMHDLARRNQRGDLTEDEESELDHFCRVGTLLSVLKARARRVLKSSPKHSGH
jgi:hypothetical protein